MLKNSTKTTSTAGAGGPAVSILLSPPPEAGKGRRFRPVVAAGPWAAGGPLLNGFPLPHLGQSQARRFVFSGAPWVPPVGFAGRLEFLSSPEFPDEIKVTS